MWQRHKKIKKGQNQDSKAHQIENEMRKNTQWGKSWKSYNIGEKFNVQLKKKGWRSTKFLCRGTHGQPYIRIQQRNKKYQTKIKRGQTNKSNAGGKEDS